MGQTWLGNEQLGGGDAAISAERVHRQTSADLDDEQVAVSVDGHAAGSAQVACELDELPALGDLERELALEVAAVREGDVARGRRRRRRCRGRRRRWARGGSRSGRRRLLAHPVGKVGRLGQAEVDTEAEGLVVDGEGAVLICGVVDGVGAPGEGNGLLAGRVKSIGGGAEIFPGRATRAESRGDPVSVVDVGALESTVGGVLVDRRHSIGATVQATLDSTKHENEMDVCLQGSATRSNKVLSIRPVDRERDVGHGTTPGETSPSCLDGSGDLKDDIEGSLGDLWDGNTEGEARVCGV